MSDSSLVPLQFRNRRNSAVFPNLPWGIAIASSGLAASTCIIIIQYGPFFTTANLFLSVLVLIAAGTGVYFYPWQTVRLFVGLYLPLRAFSMTGLIGYDTAAYASLIIAVIVGRRSRGARIKTPGLPGTGLLLGLAALVIVQFFRSTDLRNALPTLVEVIAFALVLWHLRALPEQFLQSCTESFTLGVLGAGLVMFLFSADFSERLGLEYGFNPNDLGGLLGAALLFTLSRECFKKRRWLLWIVIPLLVVLLFATGSRTSIYGCIACLGIFLAMTNPRIFWVLVICISIIVTGLVYRGVFDADPESFSGRITSPVSDSFEDSGAHRFVIWGFLVTQVPNYWKWGVGLRNVQNLTEEVGILSIPDYLRNIRIGSQAHNIYLTALLEYGILGLLLLVAWQIKVIRFGLKRRSVHALLLAVMTFFILEGFFQGQNLNFMTAFFILAAYSISCSRQSCAKYSSPSFSLILATGKRRLDVP